MKMAVFGSFGNRMRSSLDRLINPPTIPGRREALSKIAVAIASTASVPFILDTLSGCATVGFGKTSPNSSQINSLSYVPEDKAKQIVELYHSDPEKYSDRVVPALFSLFDKNSKTGFSELAFQLGQLPEIKDGISEHEIKALDELVGLYQQMPDRFEDVFRQMDKIGIKNVRKYNSPLQALFWLFEDGKSDEAKEVINDYELEDLLDRAWWGKLNSYLQIGKWMQSESRKIFDSCTDESLKKQILKYSQENPQFGNGLAIQYTIQVSREHPEKFGYVFDDRKFAVIQAKNKQRWSDFDTVADRLNSPETIEYWTRKNIEYKYYCGARFSIRKVFDKHEANCVDFARFASYLLDRSGYASGMLDAQDDRDGHTLVYFRKNGKYCLIQKTGVIPCYDTLTDIPFIILGHH